MADNTHKIVDSQEAQNNIIATQYNQSFTVTPIENSVIEKAMSSDNQAFETLFMGTYRYVFAAIRKYLNNDQDIYDAIQDTYMRVYKGISRLDSSSSFYPWLYRIAVNCAKDIIENNKIYNKTIPLDDETKITDEKSTNSDVTADVSEVLKQLPPEQAELLIRVYYDKMRNKAVKNIAAILLLTCLSTTTLVIFLVNIIIKNFSDKENVNAPLSTNSTVYCQCFKGVLEIISTIL